MAMGLYLFGGPRRARCVAAIAYHGAAGLKSGEGTAVPV
jgi:hypothetical protein